MFILPAVLLSACGLVNTESELKLLPVSAGKEFQYIDSEGKIIINPQFSEAGLFRDGLAMVSSSGDNPKVGFIDDKGMYKIQPQYLRATPFSDGLAWVVSENAAPAAVDKDGAMKFTLKDAQVVVGFSEGLAAFSVSDTAGVKWGFVDKSGAVKINPQFSAVGSFSSGLCAVSNAEGKWGYIDSNGLIKINNQFDDVEGFQGKYAPVKMGEKFGLIDESGKFVINPQYGYIYMDGDMCMIEMGEKFGWCDNTGKIIINPQFDLAFRFGSANLAPAKVGNMFGYIEKDGKVKINPQFDFAYPFVGKFALIKAGGKFGLINEDGTYMVNPQFEKISPDLITYFLTGSIGLGAIETDYFDVDGIASAVNISNWEGLTLNSTAQEIAPKIVKNPYMPDPSMPYSEYITEYTIVRDKEIGKEASVTFSIQVKPYTQVMDGWYPTNVYDPSAKPIALQYKLNLKSTKAINKKKEITDAIVKKLEGWVKNDSWSTETEMYYSKGNETIVVETSGSSISLGIAATDLLTAIREAAVNPDYYAD